MEGETSPEKTSPDADVPVWARPDAFPEKPASDDAYGYFDLKGVLHTAKDVEQLVEKAGKSRDGIDLVWTPGTDRLLVPEEVPALHKALRTRKAKHAEQDLSDGKRMGLVFGAITLWTIYAAWRNGGGKIESLYTHQLTGLAAMLLFMFGLLPLYEGWKVKRHLARTKPSDLADEIPDARFDTWLHRQKIPVTWFLLGCLLVCGLVQLYYDWGKAQFEASVIQAGLLKQVALEHPEQTDGGAWWRMLTAPMLHGNVIHFLMNAGGILYLGRRTETLARWPHLLIVFAASAWVGGLATFYWIPDKIAVGASGGLMGLLGFMLMFEILHARLVPKPARRRLLAGVVMMAVIGFLGMSFIDNAAHAGGLLAGIAYAAVVFPATASMHRPEAMKRDVVVGAIAGAVLIMAVLMTCLKVLS
ncbi:MAG: rhomboid family intramembrane serine protease [Akkermansiaceae bacterium]|nr:rhomboid family intramembrane serine protease [Akkermansiaceae bacterium]